MIGNDYLPHVLPSCVTACQQHHVGNSKQQCAVIIINIVINALHTPAVVQGRPSVFCTIVYFAHYVNQSKAIASQLKCCLLHPNCALPSSSCARRLLNSRIGLTHSSTHNCVCFVTLILFFQKHSDHHVVAWLSSSASKDSSLAVAQLQIEE